MFFYWTFYVPRACPFVYVLVPTLSCPCLVFMFVSCPSCVCPCMLHRPYPRLLTIKRSLSRVKTFLGHPYNLFIEQDCGYKNDDCLVYSIDADSSLQIGARVETGERQWSPGAKGCLMVLLKRNNIQSVLVDKKSTDRVDDRDIPRDEVGQGEALEEEKVSC